MCYIDSLLEARDAAGQQHEQQHTQCMYRGLRGKVSEPEKVEIICISANILACELMLAFHATRHRSGSDVASHSFHFLSREKSAQQLVRMA
jgi:hypothetical protein